MRPYMEVNANAPPIESASDVVIAIYSTGGWKSTAMVDLYIGELEIANEGLKCNQEV